MEGIAMKLLKKLTALFLAGITAATLGACTKEEGQSGNGSQNQEEKDQIVLGTSADYAPFEFHKIVNGEDTIMGCDVALAQKIADDMGKELVIKDMDFNSLLTELDNGTVDFVIASLAPNEERKEQVDFSDYYYTGGICCLVRAEDVDTYTTPDSLAGHSVAAQTSSIHEEVAKDQMPDSPLVSLGKVPDMIMQLKTGKVDAVLMDKDTADGYLAENDDLSQASFEVFYEESTCAVAVKKGNTQLLEQINETVKEVKEQGLFDQYMEEAKAQAPSED